MHINDCDIPDLGTVIPHQLDGLVGDHFLDHGFCLDLMDTLHGAFQNIGFFLKPREETGNITADIIHSHLAAVVDLLVVDQIAANLVCGDLSYRCGNVRQQMLNRHSVILDGSIRTALNLLGI